VIKQAYNEDVVDTASLQHPPQQALLPHPQPSGSKTFRRKSAPPSKTFEPIRIVRCVGQRNFALTSLSSSFDRVTLMVKTLVLISSPNQQRLIPLLRYTVDKSYPPETRTRWIACPGRYLAPLPCRLKQATIWWNRL